MESIVYLRFLHHQDRGKLLNISLIEIPSLSKFDKDFTLKKDIKPGNFKLFLIPGKKLYDF